ncbi:hypothetical protein [Phenylobacterium sp.]|jgi:hypothetical protein|uniref:hypothetical protein n=1 Tax=Phenylobacterium sp. TaxID=1871053 RepID=UPI000C8FE007|nr:hypothetical protein [Phenylobacterium sp.]MAK80677.1 hypothetical protein [Phenylobacterium sp.]|tara:strand:+ start:47 stop:436 length:390 start_codon:yes stop_codon:yes gene_type:complete
MPIDVRVEDADLTGFSQPAKDALEKASQEFLHSVIAEANRLESSHNTGKGPPEVTQAMVSDAVVIQKRSVNQRKVPLYIKLLRILSAVLATASGFMYDADRLQSPIYMLVFIGCITATILLTTLSTMLE